MKEKNKKKQKNKNKKKSFLLKKIKKQLKFNKKQPKKINQ